jgi:hypothetical protein
MNKRMKIVKEIEPYLPVFKVCNTLSLSLCHFIYISTLRSWGGKNLVSVKL